MAFMIHLPCAEGWFTILTLDLVLCCVEFRTCENNQF